MPVTRRAAKASEETVPEVKAPTRVTRRRAKPEPEPEVSDESSQSETEEIKQVVQTPRKTVVEVKNEPIVVQVENANAESTGDWTPANKLAATVYFLGICEILFVTTPLAFMKALIMRVLYPSEGWHRGPILRAPHVTYDTQWNVPINFHALAGIGWLIVIGINGFIGTQFSKGNFLNMANHRKLGKIALYVLMPYLCITAYYNLTHDIMPDTPFTRSIQLLTVIDVLLNVVLGYINRKDVGAHMQHMYAAISASGGAATVRLCMDICTTFMSPECLSIATDFSPANLDKFVPLWNTYFLMAAVLSISKNYLLAFLAGRLNHKMKLTLLVGDLIVLFSLAYNHPKFYLPAILGECDSRLAQVLF